MNEKTWFYLDGIPHSREWQGQEDCVQGSTDKGFLRIGLVSPFKSRCNSRSWRPRRRSADLEEQRWPPGDISLQAYRFCRFSLRWVFRQLRPARSLGRFHLQASAWRWSEWGPGWPLKVMDTEPFDFVQFTYCIVDRGAEQRLFPFARERDIAVIVNRPFRRDALLDQVRGSPLPIWAVEVGKLTVGTGRSFFSGSSSRIPRLPVRSRRPLV